MTDDRARIKNLRDRMEYVTMSMVLLFQQRTKISREIGELKRLAGLSVTDGAREMALRQQIIEEAANEGMSQDTVARFLNHLLNESGHCTVAGCAHPSVRICTGQGHGAGGPPHSPHGGGPAGL